MWSPAPLLAAAHQIWHWELVGEWVGPDAQYCVGFSVERMQSSTGLLHLCDNGEMCYRHPEKQQFLFNTSLVVTAKCWTAPS